MTCNCSIGYPTTLKSFIEISCSYIVNDGNIIKNIELNPLDYLEVKNIFDFIITTNPNINKGNYKINYDKNY